jgi:hypothetical protein
VSAPDASDRLSNLLADTDTDTSLSGMDLKETLAELLDRLRSTVDAETAAVLLRERGSDELVVVESTRVAAVAREGSIISKAKQKTAATTRT